MSLSLQSDSRFLSREGAVALAKRILSFTTGGGETEAFMTSSWTGNLRWARNTVTTSGDARDSQYAIRRAIRGAVGMAMSNDLSDVILRGVIQRAERLLRMSEEQEEVDRPSLPPEKYLEPNLWSDATYNLSADARAAAMRSLVKPVEAAQLQAAGFIEVSASGNIVIRDSAVTYYPITKAQLSITVRDPDGTGSGWAGVDQTDWTRINAAKLCEIALDKCVRSAKPTSVEPGRYTVVLEPQAVCDFVDPLFQYGAMNRVMAENPNGGGPFNRRDGRSLIGEKMFDERITITADPMDPELGFPPFDQSGNAHNPAVWVKNGVLVNLAYDRWYSIQKLGKDTSMLSNGSFKISSGNTSIDEMVATTRRGILITRFSNVSVVHFDSMLLSGMTRDGVWLIENGRISRPVRNFRFTESLFAAMNNVESIGPSIRVFHPSVPVVVPSMKIRDFSLVTLVDAI